jgi:hypothetical protein
MRLGLIVAGIAIFAPLLAERAQGAFVNDVENFIGQAFDTSTWQIRADSGTIVQNNGLAMPNGGEIVTTNALVPVGGAASVQFSISRLPGVINNYPGGVSVYLTNDSGGAGTGAFGDSFAAELDFGLWAGDTHPGFLDAFIDQSGSGTGRVIGNVADSDGAVGRQFTLEINRPSAQEYGFSVWDSSDNLTGIGQLSAPSFSGALHIDLEANTTAIFYSVAYVPEPAALSILIAGGLGLLRRPKRHKTGAVA